MQLHTSKYCFTSLPAFIHPSSPPSLPACMPACLYICMCVCMWLQSQQCVYRGDNEYCTFSVVEKAFKLLCMLLNGRLNHAGVITCITPVYRCINQLMVHCKICVLFCDGIAILFYAQMHIGHHTWPRFAFQATQAMFGFQTTGRFGIFNETGWLILGRNKNLSCEGRLGLK